MTKRDMYNVCMLSLPLFQRQTGVSLVRLGRTSLARDVRVWQLCWVAGRCKRI